MPLIASIDTKLVSRWVPSPNFGPRADGRAPDMLLLHYTGMPSHDAALAWLTDAQSKVSAHYLIDCDGTITQMVAEDKRAWHAGRAYWAGESDINSCSIGIEIHNPGHEGGYPDFPEEQMQAVVALCRDICARHAIAPGRVLAHSDVAPERKPDPGEKFDWARLYRNGVGLWVPAAPIEGDTGLGPGDQGAAVEELQRALARFGYGIKPSAVYDQATSQVVTAFQRHWRPQRVDGRADRSTIVTLARLETLAAGA